MRGKLFFILLTVCVSVVHSQSLLDKLDTKSQENKPFYTPSTFLGTRIGLGHSVETRKKNTFEFSARSRFWDEPGETSNSLLADRVCVRFGVDYGISDQLTVGGGMSTLDGIIDIYGKYRILRQQSNGGNKFGITLVQASSYRTKRGMHPIERRDSFSDKLAFTSQVLIARKFGRKISVQLAPSFVQRVSTELEENDSSHFVMGFGFRAKISKHSEFVTEYFHNFNKLSSIPTFDVISFGYNWSLKDISLQFNVSNAGQFSEDAFLVQSCRNLNSRRGNHFIGVSAIYFLQL